MAIADAGRLGSASISSIRTRRSADALPLRLSPSALDVSVVPSVKKVVKPPAFRAGWKSSAGQGRRVCEQGSAGQRDGGLEIASPQGEIVP